MRNNKPDDVPIFAKLGEMQDGWFNGVGIAPTDKAIDVAWRIYSFYANVRPHVYPTPNGGVRLEWDDVEVEVMSDGTASILVMTEAPLAIATLVNSLT